MSIGEVGGDFLLAKMSADGIFDNLFSCPAHLAALLPLVGGRDGCEESDVGVWGDGLTAHQRT